mgnify:FL=1|tara:strand:+ start:455 stop:718 length:264 start_codon:yes stop_codon:yes gene_type:complete
MGKLTNKDLEMLEKAEVFDEKTSAKVRKDGLAGTRTSSKRYMKTEDNVWVSPTLYWRNGKGTVKTKEMEEFNTKFSKLLTEYATERK